MKILTKFLSEVKKKITHGMKNRQLMLLNKKIGIWIRQKKQQSEVIFLRQKIIEALLILGIVRGKTMLIK